MLKTTSAALGSAVLAFATVPSGAMLLAEYWWVGDVLVALRFHAGLVALAALPFLAFGGSRWGSLVATLLALVQLGPGASLMFAKTPLADGGPSLRVVFVNVLASNRDEQRLTSLLETEGPDVVAVAELQPFWARVLSEDAVQAAYPHRVEFPRPGDAGMAIYSRHPIVDSDSNQVGRGAAPLVRATIDVDGCAVEVVAANAFRPTSPATSSSRVEMLGRLDSVVAGNGPLVLVGGLGTGSGSPTLRRLLDRHGLVDTRRGTGRQPTWMPVFGPLGLDVDHVLVDDDFGVRGHRTGRSIGSDHTPLVVDLVLAADGCVPPREDLEAAPE